MNIIKYSNILLLFLFFNNNSLATDTTKISIFYSNEKFESPSTSYEKIEFPVLSHGQPSLKRKRDEHEDNLDIQPAKKIKINDIYPAIHSLKDFYIKVLEKRISLNIEPKYILVCIDLDNTSVISRTNTPLEEDITKQVYSDLIEKGYSVLMLTARNDGEKRSYNQGIKSIKSLENYNKELQENIGDTKECFPGLEPREYELDTQGGEEFGYLFPGIFYAGIYKDKMLALALEDLEDVKKNQFNDDDFYYQALFMVDDDLAYLSPFKINPALGEYFEENIFLYHYQIGQ